MGLQEVPRITNQEERRGGQEEDSMIIKSCDGNLAAFYLMKENSLKIGRSHANTIRSLEITVEGEHAEIFKLNNKYYLRDNGT